MVPEGWSKDTLAHRIRLVSGQHVLAEYCNETGKGVPYLTGPADFVNGSIRITKFTDKPGVVCEPGDILVTVKGSGTGTVIKADRAYCISRQLMAVRPISLQPTFLYFTVVYNSGYYARSAAGLIPGIDRGRILRTAILVPPISVQQRIAEILSTWDRAIEQTQKLIDAKLRFKRGLMQQLLTGKMRFADFKGSKRTEYPLGDIFAERVEIDGDHLPLLSITADRGIVYRDDLAKKDTSPEDKGKYKRIVPGDIGYNTMRMWQGVSALSTFEGIVSPAYTVVTPGPGILGEFAAYLFKSPEIIHLFHRYSQGLVDDTLNLKFPLFAKVRVTLPIVAEQEKIACCLKAVDKEIEGYQKLLAVYQQQKRGLMQVLLTGKVRVQV